MLPTYCLKDGSVKQLAVHWVLLNLPVPSVYNAAMFTAQNEPAAVWDAVRHPQGLNPEHILQGSLRANDKLQTLGQQKTLTVLLML